MQVQLPEPVLEQLKLHHARCAERARVISATFGSAAGYRQTLTVEAIDRPDDPRLEEFYHLYRSVFTLEDESEPMEGFATVLGFNRDPRAQRDFGPFRELIFVLRDPADGLLAGAANFVMYAYPGKRAIYTFNASCQLNFLLVREELRGLGIARDLLSYMETEMATFATAHCGSARSFSTCEQNNPSRMTEKQIADDATTALIDPYRRTSWWHRQGFCKLDLPYIQPPLSPEHEPCRYLDYYARIASSTEASGTRLPSSVLLEHLRRFFYVSVSKFAIDIDNDPDWRATSDFLSAHPSIALISRSHHEDTS